MSIESTLCDIGQSFAKEPWIMVADIGGHYLTGLFLASHYFPEKSRTQKAMLGFFSGFSPDFDFCTMGLIQHRTITHSAAYAAALGTAAYLADPEKKEKKKKCGLKSAYDQIKSIACSRYAKLMTLGALSHIAFDSMRMPEQMIAYWGIIAAGMLIDNHSKSKGPISSSGPYQ